MVSEIGDWIGLLGIAALLYTRADLAVAASASVAALYLPYLFAPWLVGLTAKIPPRALLIGADLLRAGLIMLVLLPLPTWLLLVLVFLASVPTSVYEATRAAAVPEYAPDEETREDALVLFQSTQQAAGMVGFLLGGAALVLIGVSLAIALNAASFLLSGLLLLGVPKIDALADVTDSARGLLRNGVKALTGRRRLRQAVLLSVVGASTIMAGEALVVVYATELDHPGYAGPLAALMAFVAALLGLVLPRRRSSDELLSLSALTMLGGSALAVGAFALPAGTTPALVGYVGLGVVSAPGALTYVVAVREMAPNIRASVFALVQVAMMGGQAAVAVLAGALADQTSVERSVALWQLPTVALSVWVLAASAFGVVTMRVARRRGRHRRTGSVSWVARPVPDAPPPAAPAPTERAPSSAPAESLLADGRGRLERPATQ
jgi:MFS family permease